MKGRRWFFPLLVMGNLLTGNPANSKELFSPKNLNQLEEHRILEQHGYCARTFYSMVMLTTQEPQGFESTTVFSEDVASYSWSFVDLGYGSGWAPCHRAVLALDKHLPTGHTNLSNDGFADAFAPLSPAG